MRWILPRVKNSTFGARWRSETADFTGRRVSFDLNQFSGGIENPSSQWYSLVQPNGALHLLSDDKMISWSLRQLLNTLVLAGVTATATVAGISFWGQHRAEVRVDELAQAKDVTADILPPPLYLIEMRLVLGQALDGTLPLDQVQEEMTRLTKEHDERVTYWKGRSLEGLETELLGAQLEQGHRFMKAASELVAMARAGRMGEAHAGLPAAHALYLAHRQGVDATVAKANAQADAAMKAYQDAATEQLRGQVSVTLLATVLLGGAGWWVRRRVWAASGGEPAEVARIASAVAEGDLTVQVPVAPGDQTSAMAAVARMCHQLRGLVRQLAQSSDHIASTSVQVASSSMDLSTRTEQQAGNLQQTASAMEEFSGTVTHTAEAAGQAARMAHEASQAAVHGAQAVHRVVDTMSEISSSSRKIAEISTMIDSIAFQTNILALNAAVEAARAGEHGRGFAVVAAEVRGLAQRTATAARDINHLIDDSVSRVEGGARLVSEAGSTIDHIVHQVSRVTDLIGEISTATSEQTSGIAMVSGAITELDSATQQNTAMVEESAAAASELRGQADALVALLGRFRLERHALAA